MESVVDQGESPIGAAKVALTRAVSAIAMASLGIAGPTAAPATAEFDPGLARAIGTARAAAPCGALRYDPRVEQAASVINRSTLGYLAHTAENVPADGSDPRSIVNEFGVGAGRAITLQGAAPDPADAVHGLLLQGRSSIPDCAYTDFGVDSLYDPATGLHLIVAILAGR